jgi:hypothetical protein
MRRTSEAERERKRALKLALRSAKFHNQHRKQHSHVYSKRVARVDWVPRFYYQFLGLWFITIVGIVISLIASSLVAAASIAITSLIVSATWYYLPRNRKARQAWNISRFNSKFVRQEGKSARVNHRSARRTLQRCRSSGQPFALILRNYDLGTRRLGMQMESDGVKWTRWASVSSLGGLDDPLGKQLAEWLPVIALTSPDDAFSAWGQEPVKVLMIGQNWQPVVTNLVAAADIIVVELVWGSEGVVWELDTIAAHDKESRTVIVEYDNKATEALDRNAASLLFHGFENRPRQPFSAVTGNLHMFRRRVRINDIRDKDLSLCEAFRDLLEPLSRA